MLSITLVALSIMSAVASVSGQASNGTQTIDASMSSVMIADYYSAVQAIATDLATATAFEAAVSTVSGISTRNLADDLYSALGEAATGSHTVTKSELQYLNSLPTTGPVQSLFSTAVQAVQESESAKFRTMFGTAASTNSQASNVANSTATAEASSTGSQTSGAATTTTAAESSAAAESPTAPQTQSTSSSTGGVASQPTGIVMAAGAAAAGILAFAALL